MEDDQNFRYTQFPNLNPTREVSQEVTCLQTRWQAIFTSLPEEVLVLAWATLLQAFTRISTPVFELNGESVKIDIPSKRRMNVQVRNLPGAEDLKTSLQILYRAPQESRHDNVDELVESKVPQLHGHVPTAVAFQYDETTGRGVLSSSGCVPPSFLQELESQLLRFVYNLLPKAKKRTTSSIPLPSPSVANGQRKVLKGPLFLHDLISKHSASSVTAIDFLSSAGERVQISYSTLNRITNRLAKQITYKLRDSNSSFKDSTIVPVLIPQCPELYCAWIAVLKAGAAFCPLGLDMPPERMKYILKDVNAKVVLTLPQLKAKLTPFEPQMQIVEVQDTCSLAKSINGVDPHLQHCSNKTSQSPAYVMYTSGSTGVPKGVLISHGSATQALLAHDEHVPVFQRFLQFASPTFDVSVFETFFPLFRGATLVTRHREHMLGDLPGTLKEMEVDAAELTPTVAGTLLQRRDSAPCLRLLLTIGEMLTRPLVEEFGQTPGRRGMLLPMYGPTEASIHCTCAPTMDASMRVGIIGQPLCSATAVIIAETGEFDEGMLEALPIGQIGELAVAGQLATEYINRPEQTTTAFREHPTYGRIYRTGDRARLLPNGDLECLGRISTGQVKIRGQRVELGEIEQVICRVQGVQSAVAAIIDDALVAFCITDKAPASQEQIRSSCKSWLPNFMRPNDIVLIDDHVPRLPSGKIDKKQLESDYRGKTSNAEQYPKIYPTDLERQILRCINEEVSVRATRTDDLWSRGLDSLKAIKLASKLRGEGLWINVSDIMAADDVVDIARTLKNSYAVQGEEPKAYTNGLGLGKAIALPSFPPGVDGTTVEEILPCSPLQLAMIGETVAQPSLNFNTIQIQLSERVSVAGFQQAFQNLAKRNKILRSGFVATEIPGHAYVRVVWESLDDEALGRSAIPNAQVRHSRTTTDLLLRPLKLQFIDSTEARLCMVYIHHALYDGWSWDLVMQDLEKLIMTEAIPERPHFDEVTKYHLQNRFEIAQPTTQAHWQDRLLEISPTPFPNLNAESPLQNSRQACVRLLRVDTSDLTSSSQTLHASCQSIVSAAFALLLRFYLGSSDVVFGVVSSGRTIPVPGIEHIIGPCIDTLPMRLDLSRLRTAGDLVHSTHRQQLDNLRFCNITLRDIKKLSGIGGNEALFDTLFLWQEGLEEFRTSSGLLTVVDTVDTIDYALVLEVEPKGDKLCAKLSFETSKLPLAHAELFLSQLDSLVAVFSRSSITLIEDCCSQMDSSLLSLENSQCEKFDNSFTLTSTIKSLAEKEPARVAIEFVNAFDPQCGSLSVTKIKYNELYRRSSAVSRNLLSQGISSDEVVTIHLEKSVELYVVILGVILSGAAYLAIDPRTPTDRVRKILEDSRCRIMVGQAQEQSAECLTEGCELWSTSDLESEIEEGLDGIDPYPASKGSNLAYVVYTSGSTGVPKGVLITRDNILSNINCLSRLYPTGSDSRLLQACSQAFDVSVFEIFFTWHMGMSLCVAANDVLFRDMEQLIRKLNVSHLSLTPSVAALLHPDRVPSVEFLVTAGEPMNSKVFNDWSGRGLFQGYGPSETTNICNVRPAVTVRHLPSNVGPPLPNTSIFICKDKCFDIVPKGGIGEVWIGGDQVGRGYMHNDELTAKSFVDDSVHGRLYRSGDVGRLLSDRSLMILGREDDQVKLRGQRVELGDINQALVNSVAVADAASLILDDTTTGKAKLVSFWMPNSGELDDQATLQEQAQNVFAELMAELPAYMIPNVLLPVPSLPLTKQGKIDRKVLIAQLRGCDPSRLQRFSYGASNQDGNDTLSEDESEVAKAVAEVVGCAQSVVGRDVSFFSLGMDSINSIALSRKLRGRSGQVDVSEILRNASVRRLAKLLSSKGPEGISSPPGKPFDLEDVFDSEWRHSISDHLARLGLPVEKFLPCTPLQESMLSSSNIGHPDSYHNRMVFHVRGDIARLKQICEGLVPRYQLLRTGFTVTESSKYPFAQVVFSKFDLPWLVTDDHHRSHHSKQPTREFILPPYSIEVNEAGEDSQRLTLNMHHALYDGEALSLLLAEVETLYHGGHASAVVPFDRYLEYMLGLDPPKVDDYWHKQLEGYRPALIGDLFSATTSGRESAFSVSQLTSGISFSSLEAESKRMSTTILSMLQASWTRLLSCYLQSTDICFGNVYSGRTIPVTKADQIVGPCFNTLPLRKRLEKWQSIHELVKSLQDINLAMLPYQPSSLRAIQRQHGCTRRPLFDTLLLLQPPLKPLDADLWTLMEDSGDMDFPVICEIVPDTAKDELALKLHLRSTHFSSSEGHRMLENFDLLLQHDTRYTSAASRDVSVLRGRLPSLKLPRNAEQAPYSATGEDQVEGGVQEVDSDVEILIRQLLSEVSGMEAARISRSTSIYRLGLDSINAVQIAARLRHMGFHVTGGDVMEAATTEDIALLCHERSVAPKEEASLFDLEAFDQRYRSRVCQQVSAPASSIEAVRPCTSTQAGILVEFINSNGQLYFNSLRLKIKQPHNTDRLKGVWTSMNARHEMLRTGFVQIDDAEHPFVMITYRPGVKALQWNESLFPPEEPVEKAGGRRALKSLHEPPWYLLYVMSGGECYLKLSMLHALYDAQSLDVILNEVAAVYSGNDLPAPIRIGHSLSLILSRSIVENPSSEALFSKLGKNLQPTKFPDLNTHRDWEKKNLVATHWCSKTLHKLRKGCQLAGISLQVATQCAWARLLAAYTGQENVTFGVILSGRDVVANNDSTVFPTMNTMPVSLTMTGSVKELLGAASKLSTALMQRQHIPFTQVKRWLNVEGSLFDTVVVLQQYQSSSTQHDLWEVVSDDSQTEHAVSVEILPDENQDKMQLRLTFKDTLLPLEHAKVLLAQYEAILYSTIYHSESGDDLQPPAEFDRGLFSVVAAQDERIPTSTRLLHTMVENSVQTWPERIALEFATRIEGQDVSKNAWTYAQLNHQANKVAHLLVKEGARPGDMISVCFDKCPEASFALFGVLKAGCAFVALDPNAPRARKDFILQDSDSRILLCQKNRLGDFHDIGEVTVLAVDDETSLFSLSAKEPQLSRDITPNDVCYCLYTSGTTGQPKGCLITHDNAVQALLSFQRIFASHWDDDSRWLQFASFHFDVSVLEQFWSWSVGICVTSAPRDLLFEDLPGAIRALEITHLDLTPSLAGLLRPDEVPSLCRGVFITGGEQLRQDVLDVWGDAGVLYNFYGPSEVTIGCTVHKRVRRTAKPSNIGQQFDNVGSFVLDVQTKRPVLRGAIGELCLSGPLVGKGYLNRPELSKSRFELLSEFNVCIYHTGDLVRMLHNGSFEFLGRADDQVKLRGQRLEIGEINHVIHQADGNIKDVTTQVMVHPRQTNEQLVSFLSWADRGTKAASPSVLQGDNIRAQVAQIARRCVDNLPGYMVPTYFVPVSVMPLSANNKADIITLKTLLANTPIESLHQFSMDAYAASAADQAVIDKVVSILSLTFQLQVSEIKPRTSLFELGMDSISAIGFAKSLKDGGFDAARQSLVMRYSTVASLAAALGSSAILEDSNTRPREDATQRIAQFADKYRSIIPHALAVSKDSIDKIAPCTPLQEGMILRALNSTKGIYAPTFTYKLSNSVDLERLHSAWTRVQSNNQILRTRFVPTEDGYAQVVLKSSDSYMISTWKCTSSNDPQIERHLQNDLQAWHNTAECLDSMPWRVVLIGGYQQKMMIVHLFHALFDGTSLPLLLEDVAQEYLGRGGQPSRLDFHDVLPYGPLCRMEGARDFWEQNLPFVYPLELPLVHANQAATLATSVTSNTLYSEELHRLRRLLKVTEPALFHAAWLLLLNKHFGAVPTLGIVVSGRSINVEEAQGVIGPLFNTLPCSIGFGHGSSRSDLIQACHNFNINSLPFQHTPLRDISKWIKHDTSQSLFNSLFVFQKEDDLNSSRQLWTEQESLSEPDFPLAVEVQQRLDRSFTVTIVAQPQFMNVEEVQELLSSFHNVIRELVADADAPLPFPTKSQSGRMTNDSKSRTKKSSSSTFVWNDEATRIRQEVAALADIDIEDVRGSSSIFELGLDSIDAIKLSARLKKHGTTLAVSSIMRKATVQAMTEACTPTDSGEAPQTLSTTAPGKSLEESLRGQGVNIDDYEMVLPVTPLQEGMLARFEQYYGHDVLELEPGIDSTRLKLAWEDVVNANTVLRTSFVAVEDPNSAFTYAQLVPKLHWRSSGPNNSGGPAIEWRELTIHDESDIDLVMTLDKQKAIEGGLRQPLIHLTLLNFNERRLLVLGMSHTIYDGWSANLLHQDVADSYNGQLYKRPSYEPALEYIIGGGNHDAKVFWDGLLRQASPSIFCRNAQARGAPDLTIRRQAPSVHRAKNVQDFCKVQGITVQALGLTCFSIVLAGQLKKLDVCFGLVLSGRNMDDFERMMFPTMNTVIFSTSLGGSRSAMLKSIHNQSIRISEHQFFPLRRAKAICDFEGSVFDALFIYQKRPTSDQDHQELYHSVRSSSSIEYPVNVEMELEGSDLIWRTACQSSVISEAGVERMLEEFDLVLDELLDRPNEPVVEALTANQVKVCGTYTFEDATNLNGNPPENRLTSHSGIPLAESPATASANSANKQAVHPDHEWSPMENMIRDVLASVSGTTEEQITRTTSIFNLGLDSISSIKVSSILKKKSISLPVSTILSALTVERMATVASPVHSQPVQASKPALKGDSSSQRREQDSSLLSSNFAEQPVYQSVLTSLDPQAELKLLEDVRILPEEIESLMPVTGGQSYALGMYSASEGRLFSSKFSYKCTSPRLTPEKLERAWTETFKELPILRTTFIACEGRQLQVVLKSVINPIVWFCEHESIPPPRSSIAGPQNHFVPVKVLARKSSSGFLLRLSVHHALYDAVSLPTIISTLNSKCRDPAAHDPIQTSLRDFFSATTTVSASQSFWTDYLGNHHGDANLQLAGDFATLRTEKYIPWLMDDISDLDRVSRHHGLSVQSIFIAAYAVIRAGLGAKNLSLCKDEPAQKTIVIGVYLANRSLDIQHLSDLPHPTFNVVPLRVKLSPNAIASILSIAKTVQRDLREISKSTNCGIPLQEIHEWTGVRLNSTVNFLKLPEHEDEGGSGQEEAVGQDAIRFEAVEESWGGDDKSQRGKDDPTAPSPFAGNPPSRGEVFLPSIDIEAKIRDGGLDVGVFAPENMLDEEGAERILQELRALLLQATRDGLESGNLGQGGM